MNNRLLKQLKINDSIEVTLHPTPHSAPFQGQITNVLADNTIFLSLPISFENIISNNSLNPLLVRANLLNEFGIIETLGTCIQWQKDGNSCSIVLKLHEEFNHIQRREYFRLPLIRSIHLERITEPIIDGFSQDISAGGIRCILNTHLEIGTPIIVTIELNKTLITLKGTVLETLNSSENNDHIIHRICFANLTEKNRSKLLYCIFNEQSRIKKSMKIKSASIKRITIFCYLSIINRPHQNY